MEYIDLKEAKKSKKGILPIGVGTTAECFLTKDGRTLKLYKNTVRKNYMFYLFDGMTEHLEELSKVSNFSFVGPVQIVLKDDKCAGYTYTYRKADTLDHLDYKIKIEDLIQNYRILEDDTAKISQTGFCLNDLHSANMLYNEYLYIIDLDMGTFYVKDPKDIFKKNMGQINETIIYGIFFLPSFYRMHFKDPDLQALYTKCTKEDYKELSNLLKEIQTYRHKIETVGDARRYSKRLIKVDEEDYYHMY